MVKFVIGKPDEGVNPVLRVWLELGNRDTLLLRASECAGGKESTIAFIDPETGMLVLPICNRLKSIKTDASGSIKVAGYKRINDD